MADKNASTTKAHPKPDGRGHSPSMSAEQARLRYLRVRVLPEEWPTTDEIRELTEVNSADREARYLQNELWRRWSDKDGLADKRIREQEAERRRFEAWKRELDRRIERKRRKAEQDLQALDMQRRMQKAWAELRAEGEALKQHHQTADLILAAERHADIELGIMVLLSKCFRDADEARRWIEWFELRH
jgi:hypothetical protein